MEEYRGLAILATNNKTALDYAFLRRIRFIVNFPFPDAANRQLIWEKAFPKKVPVNGLMCDALARLEIPGGNIRNIAVNAAFLADVERGWALLCELYTGNGSGAYTVPESGAGVWD
jgi:SpoVK/Ycf46/Vps4 family AAA+-type ATPase